MTQGSSLLTRGSDHGSTGSDDATRGSNGSTPFSAEQSSPSRRNSGVNSRAMGDFGWKYLTAADKEAIVRGIEDGVAYGGPYHVEIHPACSCVAAV